VLVDAEGGRAHLCPGCEPTEVELNEKPGKAEGPEVALARGDLSALTEVGAGGGAFHVGVLGRVEDKLRVGGGGAGDKGKDGGCSVHLLSPEVPGSIPVMGRRRKS